MSLEVIPQRYGAHFSELSPPESRAAIRYIKALARDYPDIATQATAGPGNEGAVYIYVSLPPEENMNIEIHEAAADVALDILLDTAISIVLMPAPE